MVIDLRVQLEKAGPVWRATLNDRYVCESDRPLDSIYAVMNRWDQDQMFDLPTAPSGEDVESTQ